MKFDEAFAASLPSPEWGHDARRSAWALIVDVGQWAPYLAEARQLLDQRELARVRRMRRDGDALVLTLSYALHRLLLGHFLRTHPAVVDVYRDHLGCPRVAGGAYGTSLSHSGQWIAMAVLERGSVGIDIEPRERCAQVAELVESICHPDEAAALSRRSAAERACALLKLWVRKEALLKALGVGLTRDDMASFAAPAGSDLFIDRSGERLVLTMLDQSAAWLAAVACAPGVPVQSFLLPAAP